MSEQALLWFCSSEGHIELGLTERQVLSVPRSGPADDAILALSKEPDVAAQLAKINPQKLVHELRGYGAWSGEELADHQQNLQRILWLAVGDIADDAANQ